MIFFFEGGLVCAVDVAGVVGVVAGGFGDWSQEMANMTMNNIDGETVLDI